MSIKKGIKKLNVSNLKFNVTDGLTVFRIQQNYQTISAVKSTAPVPAIIGKSSQRPHDV